MTDVEPARPAAEPFKGFAGSIPDAYDTYMVPMIFEPYAADLAKRLAPLPLTDVLEVAAGTGVVTRALASTLPGSVRIVATDVSPAMLARAEAVGTARPMEWRQADALHLPFDDVSFDAVVCQFGVMFFPDKAAAFREARRVLRPGGVLVFSVWDRIEENEFAAAAGAVLQSLFPDAPPRFAERIPHGYWDHDVIRRDVAAGGFTKAARIETVAARSRAESARTPALAYCHGTPMRTEIEGRDAARLDEVTDAVEREIDARFGPGPVDGKIQAHVITVEK